VVDVAAGTAGWLMGLTFSFTSDIALSPLESFGLRVPCCCSPVFPPVQSI
jgi:hypothetical protein